MEARVLILPDNEDTRQAAAEVIARGGVIAFRTDTFYGLGADPFNAEAVSRIKALKGREERKPILLIISDSEQIDRFIEKRSEPFDRLSSRFWPGPLTLIGKARTAVSDQLTAGSGTIGVRLPDDADVVALIHACGGALTGTSANPAGQDPAETAAAVARYFSDGIDLIIDGGPARTDWPSTVMDLSRESPVVIREGMIGAEDISRELASVDSGCERA